MHNLTVDLSGLSCGCVDHSLEFMHKSLADPPDDKGIWARHPDPLIADTVEVFAAAGEAAFKKILRELLAALRASLTLSKAFKPDRTDVLLSVAKLSAKAPRDYTVEDWLTLIDWLVLEYLPEAFIKSQAEYLAVRAAIAGKIKALEPAATPLPGYSLALPTTIGGAMTEFAFLPLQKIMLHLAAARAGEAITDIGDSTRHRMKQLVINHLEARATGSPGRTIKALESSLLEEFGMLNRDWRRIAVTETGNIAAESQIAALPYGATVRRFEAYQGACPFCQKINGMVFTVCDPRKEKKDGWKEVWVGKTNRGRSASPRKREGDELVERTPEERWWPAAGVQHPSCRGGWTVVNPATRDAKTQDFITMLIAKHGLKI